MKFAIAFVALFFATLVLAQENNKLNSATNATTPVPAVKKTAVVFGESFLVKRDKNNKLVFVKSIDNKIVHPIKVTIQ